MRGGWVLGAGAEVAIAPDWSARLEYLYDNFGKAGVTMPSGVRSETSFDAHTLRLGLNWHLGRTEANALPFESHSQPLMDPANWNIHGQYTLIGQGYPSFHSPYEGPKSLAGSKQFQDTQSATAYIGVRLGEGAEFYINPELMQGFGLSDVNGIAGFTNGEAQKSNFPSPRLNVARVFLRQTFGLGGEQETINDGPNQLAGKQDVSRITVTAGKFAVTDAFNGNIYAYDPRTTFLNWNIYGGGSYDWTMDKLSWTWALSSTSIRKTGRSAPAISCCRPFPTVIISTPTFLTAVNTQLSWSCDIRCFRSPANCGCSAGSITAPWVAIPTL
jgi:high affinity Mn2+ porin